MKKRLVSLILCMVLVANFLGISAYAQEEKYDDKSDFISSSVQPRYSYIKETDVKCFISGGTLNYSARVTRRGTASSCKVMLKLYARPQGGSWECLTFSTKTGDLNATIAGQRVATSGYEYKVYASFTAYASDGTGESTSYYSDIAP